MCKCRCLKSKRPGEQELAGPLALGLYILMPRRARRHVSCKTREGHERTTPPRAGRSRRRPRGLHRRPLGCSAAAGQDKKDSKSSGDLKKLQGVWTTPSQSGEAVVYTFKEDKLTVKAPTRTYKMTVKLDESAKPNKTIDLKVDDGPEDAKGQTSKGIYKFDGDDKFVFCFTPAAERPEKFEQVGFEQFLTELKREKESRK
ncbi:MAG TPA: TIGR03067 domain-containing protein [Tepidisphaeraceae bacterium]|nr:TIGR03067 domain-containing protein [Tepidisphaeraceae bacterium]